LLIRYFHMPGHGQVSIALSMAAKAAAMTGSKANLDMRAPETGMDMLFLGANV
jgi:hypothetical protein